MTLFTPDDIYRLEAKYQNRPPRKHTAENIDLTAALINMMMCAKKDNRNVTSSRTQ